MVSETYYVDVCDGGEDKYRFGFNGMEKDNELKGIGNSLDFGARMYDSRLGRWLSLDPLAAKYPSISPYAFVSNSPLMFVDPDGRRPDHYLDANTGKYLGSDGANTSDVRIIHPGDWNYIKEDHGSTISTAATNDLQANSSIITINSEQINNDLKTINDETIKDQSRERQFFIGLEVTWSDDGPPTAQITSKRGLDGLPGNSIKFEADITYEGKTDVVRYRKIPNSNMFLLAQVHTHNKTQIKNTKNSPGASEIDHVMSEDCDCTIYVIDSYTGENEQGNRIHRYNTREGDKLDVGNTKNHDIGKDALDNYIKDIKN